IVMPRSRSIGLLSSTCSVISRSSSPPHSWMKRSASVDFPWSMWAMIEKLRMWDCCMGALRKRRRSIAEGSAQGVRVEAGGAQQRAALVQQHRHLQPVAALPFRVVIDARIAHLETTREGLLEFLAELLAQLAPRAPQQQQ